MATELRELHYSGNVQGVGFRATAQAIACDLGLSGYVMNLPDGSVKLVAEGNTRQLDLLQQRLADRMGHNISDTTRDVRPATGEFAEFKIRY